MIRTIILIILASSIIACTSTKIPISQETRTQEAPKEDLKIIEIAQGKMRKVDEKYVIYEQTSDMAYGVNDQCIYNKEPIECLRHGFTIKYDSSGKDLRLDCVARTNIAVNAGNIAEEKYVDTMEDDFYIDLEASKNEFVNVQYISGQPGLEDLKIDISCSYKGKEVLQLKQRVRFKQSGT